MIELLAFLIIVRIVLDVTSISLSLHLDFAYAVLFFIVGAVAFSRSPHEIWAYIAFAVGGYYIFMGLSRQKSKDPSP